jgi:hypothetical protein
MSVTYKISTAAVGRAMKKADGDYAKAAKILDMPTWQSVKARVRRDPSLRAIWQPNNRQGDETKEVDVIAQEPNELLASKEEVRALEANGREIYEKGIEKFLGDDPELMERFGVFKEIEGNIGIMFAETTRFFQTKLVEILCNLTKMDKSLDERIAAAIDPEDYAMFVRLKLQTCDMFGKYYDRNLAGLETMVKLTEKEEKKAKKKKPGFRPLKELSDG